MDTKTCSKCNLIKQKGEFNQNKYKKDGLRAECKDCQKKQRLKKKLKSTTENILSTEWIEAASSGIRQSNQTISSSSLLNKKRTRNNINQIIEEVVRTQIHPTMKQCKGSCKQLKNLSEFHKDNRNIDGYRNICKICAIEIKKENKLKLEARKAGKTIQRVIDSKFPLIGSSIKDLFNEYEVVNTINSYGHPLNIIETNMNDIKDFLNKTCAQASVNVWFKLNFEMKNKSNKNFPIEIETNKFTINNNNDVEDVLADMYTFFGFKLDDNNYEESGLIYIGVNSLIIKTSLNLSQFGSSFRPLPKIIENKKACLNIQNNDNKCFIWCILADLYPCENNPHRSSNYFSLIDQINGIDQIRFPIRIDDIKKFQKLNPHIPPINVFELETKHGKITDTSYNIFPIYPREVRDNYDFKSKSINLLFYQDHYILIKNLNRLLFDPRFPHLTYICERCIAYFSSESALNKHHEYCKENKTCKITLPVSGSGKEKLKFVNYKHQVVAPFIIYADFETWQEIVNMPAGEKTIKTAIHHPSAFAFFTVCRSDSKLNKYFNYNGKDSAEQFVFNIKEELKRIDGIFNSKPIPINMDENATKDFNNACTCYHCNLPFTSDNYKVRDHDHLNGKYRGAAHLKCNSSSLKTKRIVSIVFHNLEGYDIHLFIKEIVKHAEIEVIPKSSEKYISMICKFEGIQTKLKFIDSFHFLNSSLDELSKNIIDFKYIHDTKLREKQYFPYEYITSYETLLEPHLPPIEKFESKLNNTCISVTEYNHALSVFNDYNCKNILDYQELYLKIDVLLLSEIFENFRDVTLANYNLDPANYYTTPGLAWDAALKLTNVELELLTDVSMLDLFGSKAIRGGISTVCERKLAYANNKYMDKYDNQSDSSYIMYLDANNLYGHSMSQKLPISDFQWVKIENICIEALKNDKDWGYILEVDLEYPKYLHTAHNEYPLAPEHFEEKLCPNLFDKEKYVVHVKNLHFYIQHGLILKKVHKVLKFKEDNWLSKYITFNTEKRKKSKNEFEKNFYKLMNNAVYGKTMENIRKRVNLKIVSDENSAMRLMKKCNFKRFIRVNENMTMIEMATKELFYNKPIYLGFTVLELSKLHMYEFHYDYIKSKFPGDKSKLMYTDTDSLVYNFVGVNDIYEEFQKEKELFDMSEYTEGEHMKFLDKSNSKVIGKFKDEFANKIITSFVALKSKTYSTLTQNLNNKIEEKKKCKGIKKHILKNEINHDDYIQICKNPNVDIEKSVNFRIFKSDKHTIETLQITKTALDNKDSKRIQDINNYSKTYAHGFQFI